jgi:hypothetical protein
MTSLSALVGRHLEHDGGINIPVRCEGVLVHPGDLIVADDNGIVVIRPDEAEELYETARWWEDRSPHQRVWLQNGGSFVDLTGLGPEQIAEKNRERGWACEGAGPCHPRAHAKQVPARELRLGARACSPHPKRSGWPRSQVASQLGGWRTRGP